MANRIRRPFHMRPNRLAVKIAVPSAALLVCCFALIDWLFAQHFSWIATVAMFVLATIVVYTATYVVIGLRVRLAHKILLQIRRRQFDELETARVEEGDELNNLIRQVYRTGRALQQEIEEMKNLEDYRREYLGNVSHELKTPIFAIQGFAETLLDGAIEDEKVNRRFLSRIINHSERLTNLTNDLTEISRIESGELKMTMKAFDLEPLVGEVMEWLEVERQQSDIELRKNLPEYLPAVVADRVRVRQVLVNLIENAIKYNKAGGFVEVQAEAPASGHVKISVVDEGIGIAPHHIPRLTERFYRIDKSRSRTKGGTGLGLAIVKHILEAHGQRLIIESKRGEGSTFSFLLPTQGIVAPINDNEE